MLAAENWSGTSIAHDPDRPGHRRHRAADAAGLQRDRQRRRVRRPEAGPRHRRQGRRPPRRRRRRRATGSISDADRGADAGHDGAGRGSRERERRRPSTATRWPARRAPPASRSRTAGTDGAGNYHYVATFAGFVPGRGPAAVDHRGARRADGHHLRQRRVGARRSADRAPTACAASRSRRRGSRCRRACPRRRTSPPTDSRPTT